MCVTYSNIISVFRCDIGGYYYSIKRGNRIMGKLYRNPLDMFSLSYDKWRELPEDEQSRLWREFCAHVNQRGYAGLYTAYGMGIAEGRRYDPVLKEYR